MRAGRVRLSLALCLTLILADSAAAQGASAFVGDWKLVSSVRPDSAGSGQRDVWGPKPLGIIHYSSTGVMAAQLYDERRRPPSVPNFRDMPPAETRDAFVAMASYFGTYAVDTVARTVTHTVVGAWTPDWIGRKLVRGYRFIGSDRIELRVISGPDGKPTRFGSVLVWERIPDRGFGAP